MSTTTTNAVIAVIERALAAPATPEADQVIADLMRAIHQPDPRAPARRVPDLSKPNAPRKELSNG